METIKNYLEGMFASLPNTEEVLRAKDELLQMMEDKYSELIEDGVSENEAVGTVISEFGNLQELSGELGLEEAIKERDIREQETPRREVSYDQAKEYLLQEQKHAGFVALGVFLCIISVTFPIFSDLFGINDAFGVLGMFLSIGCAVGLFVYSGSNMNKWEFLKREACSIDILTAEYVQAEQERYLPTHSIRVTIGVVLCAICWLPAVCIDELFKGRGDEFAGALLFYLVGAGVFLLVYSGSIKKSYEKILYLNDRSTVGGSYIKRKEEEEYINDFATTVMSVFWPTVSCLYFAFSFLTFKWYISWIIWPIAAIGFSILKNVWRKK